MAVKVVQVVLYWSLSMATVTAISSTWAGSLLRSMKHIIIPSISRNIVWCWDVGTRDIVSMAMSSSMDLERRTMPGCEWIVSGQRHILADERRVDMIKELQDRYSGKKSNLNNMSATVSAGFSIE